MKTREELEELAKWIYQLRNRGRDEDNLKCIRLLDALHSDGMLDAAKIADRSHAEFMLCFQENKAWAGMPIHQLILSAIITKPKL